MSERKGIHISHVYFSDHISPTTTFWTSYQRDGEKYLKNLERLTSRPALQKVSNLYHFFLTT